MALVGVELETLVSETDALTSRPRKKTEIARHTVEATYEGLKRSADAKTQRIAALSLVNSTSEHCAPV